MFTDTFDELEAEGLIDRPGWLTNNEKLELAIGFLDTHSDTVVTPKMFRAYVLESQPRAHATAATNPRS